MSRTQLPLSRIRIARHHQPPATTAADYQKHFRVAHEEPIYPAAANGREGEVQLEAVIGKDGRMLSLAVQSGDPVLACAAIGAVRKWRYRPLSVNGVPVEVDVDIDGPVNRR